WVERGEILLAVGDYEASQASFEMALKCLDTIRSDTSGGLFAIMRRGEVLQRLGRFDEALANFESVVVSGKLNSASIVRVLALHRLLGRWELPRAVRQAAETAPEPDVKLEYARFLVDAGELATAERMLSLVADVLGTGAEFALVKARLASAKAIPTEESVSERAVLSGPIAGAALVAEAETRESSKELEVAARLYSLALSASPSDVQAAIGLARCRLALGNHKSALALADRAIGMDTCDWEPHIIKAEAFESLGDAKAAENERAHAKAIADKAGVKLGEITGEGPM
ncbi:MAG TPA: tetratricopeptide repeat protein, partial [Thermoplasmata archaeon]